MPGLDEKRVREIVKEEIGSSKIPERLAVIEEQNKEIRNILDRKADKSDIAQLNLKFDNLKEQMKDDKKLIVGFFILVIITVIGAAIAR